MANIIEMSSCKRLETVFQGGTPDRTPTLGGWIACPEHICNLADVSSEEYWNDPIGVSVKAYKKLQVDGLVSIFVPAKQDDFRCVDENTYMHADTGVSLEETLEMIEKMPSPEEIERKFNLDEEYEKYKKNILERQSICGDMVYMPAGWWAGAKINWFIDLGYENFYLIVGMYPDHARKLLEIGGATGHNFSEIIARAVKEGIYPHAVLLGDDICTQRGPMVSPEFLKKYYAPQLRYGLEPLLEAGCRPVWHSDGDIRLIVDMLIDCGVQGFQGFQPECGMNIEYIVQKRNRNGGPLLIFGPISVTTELPVCTPGEIKNKVKHAIRICKDKADLALFTSNTINPDVPLENIIAMYEA
ncbi:MAG: hypothetical protein FIA99_19615, partial [Ruminiclostridium sp.]|nr:hypothetical protein [Ruminiclostridium sp.]